MIDEENRAPAKLAKVIRVDNRGGSHSRVYVDGELFPWATVDGFTVQSRMASGTVLPCVSLRVLAERIEYVDDINGES